MNEEEIDGRIPRTTCCRDGRERSSARTRGGRATSTLAIDRAYRNWTWPRRFDYQCWGGKCALVRLRNREDRATVPEPGAGEGVCPDCRTSRDRRTDRPPGRPVRARRAGESLASP